jgi:hypothetical protein
MVDESGEPMTLKGHNVFDLGATGFREFQEIGPRATWIMLRALSLANGPKQPICKDEKAFAVHLKRLMALYCKWSLKPIHVTTTLMTQSIQTNLNQEHDGLPSQWRRGDKVSESGD